VSTNSRKTKTTTYGTCRHQIAIRWFRGRYFYFRFTSAILLFTVIIIYLCRAYIHRIARPLKVGTAAGISQRLFLTEGFTISGLRCHLGSLYVGPWQHVCIPGLQLWTKHVYDTKTYVFLMDVAHFWVLRYIFRPYISVHFRNLFVIHIVLPVKTDIKKP